MTTPSFIYDDRSVVPAEISAWMGIDRFSNVLFRKRTLLEHTRNLAHAAGMKQFVHLRDEGDVEHLRKQLDEKWQDSACIYLPSHVVPRDLAAAKLFLRQLQYTARNLWVPLDSSNPALMRVGPRTRDLLVDALRRGGDLSELTRAHDAELFAVQNEMHFEDISSSARFIEFLSSNFDARHFNEVRTEGPWITKRSKDKAKLKREYSFHRLIEGPIESFFLRPFDFREDDAGASYRVERLNVPDASLQWIHGAFSVPEFSELLERLLAFLQARPLRTVDSAIYQQMSASLFADKLSARMTQLKTQSHASRIQWLIQENTPWRSVDALVDRWQRLWARQRAPRKNELAVSHGDLCFSNMLYDKRTRQLKLIDPRGASTADELYMHPYYDIAKLSHSVLGGYDFINHGLFDLQFDNDLGLSLTLQGPSLAEHQRTFTTWLENAGWSVPFVRLCEASLFLSMLPLHADVPKKVLAFVAVAAGILDELELSTNPRVLHPS